MNFVYGITTFNRFDYFKKNIETWNETRNRNIFWYLIICDDGSTDETIDYINSLNFENVKIIFIKNNRRGVHYQINKIFQECESLEFDFAFISEDDIYFKSKGWDVGYYDAAINTGYHHLCYYSASWAKEFRNPKDVIYKRIINKNIAKYCQCHLPSAVFAFGCFWTFSKKVLNKVGYFDCENFSLFGNGHTDYSCRCCRCGFNDYKYFCDLKRSEKYIEMQKIDYKGSISEDQKNIASNINIQNSFHKGKIIKEKRKYIPYNEIPYNMKGEKIL